MRRSLLSLRIIAAFQSILMLVQVALAGGFLGGHFDMLAIHGTLGRVIAVVALLMAVAAFFVRRFGGPRSLLPASVVLLLALVVQIGLGLGRSVASHVLLGVVLVSAVAVLSQRVMTTPLPVKSPAVPAPDETVQPEPAK
ncbi:hypothetical protein ACFU8Q_10900 [Streptomyces sp. NPDC057543]|uniref:hypothetical protein n=1 Tax=Streptomyces sp. NPDC057543 TaxID=3346163 RepID=UPI0036A2ED20